MKMKREIVEIEGRTQAEREKWGRGGVEGGNETRFEMQSR